MYLIIIGSYGLCGLLRPLTVYPSEMVYWLVSPTIVRRSNRPNISTQGLPMVSIFQCPFHLILHCLGV